MLENDFGLPRRLRESENKSRQEYRRNDLASQRYAPFLAVPCASPCHITTISDPCSEDLSESVEELLQARDLASDLAVCELGLVDGYLRGRGCQLMAILEPGSEGLRSW